MGRLSRVRQFGGYFVGIRYMYIGPCNAMKKCFLSTHHPSIHPHWYHGKKMELLKIASKVYDYNNNFRRLNHGLLKLTFAGLETSLNQMTME
jgi:hypothetical protein